MKKFLALTLVLFLSLFIVGESKSDHKVGSIKHLREIMTDGKVITSTFNSTQNDIDADTSLGSDMFTMLISYQGLYWCRAIESRERSGQFWEFDYFYSCYYVHESIK